MISKEAVKVEEKQRDYELTLVISPEIGEEALDTAIAKVSQLITGKGGIISQTDKWGKKKLAYPIRHFMEGTYVLIKLKLQPALSKQLEANLEISEDVLRYLLIKMDG